MQKFAFKHDTFEGVQEAETKEEIEGFLANVTKQIKEYLYKKNPEEDGERKHRNVD
jgi:hypothetical protein